jgi:hypothetical protein
MAKGTRVGKEFCPLSISYRHGFSFSIQHSSAIFAERFSRRM